MSKTSVHVALGAVLILGVAASPFGDSAPGFFGTILLAPLLSGAVAVALGRAWRPVAAAWALSGLLMLVVDWVVNDEDQFFHLVLTGWMAALVAAGAGLARWLSRARRSRPARLPA
jgi:hypothetical protein